MQNPVCTRAHLGNQLGWQNWSLTPQLKVMAISFYLPQLCHSVQTWWLREAKLAKSWAFCTRFYLWLGFVCELNFGFRIGFCTYLWASALTILSLASAASLLAWPNQSPNCLGAVCQLTTNHLSSYSTMILSTEQSVWLFFQMACLLPVPISSGDLRP